MSKVRDPRLVSRVVGGLKLKCIQGSGRPVKRAKGADVRERGELQRTESTLAQEDPLLLGMQTSAPGPFVPFIKKRSQGTSLMVQWLRICLAMQGTWVPSLVRELRSHRATKLATGQLSLQVTTRESVSHS